MQTVEAVAIPTLDTLRAARAGLYGVINATPLQLSRTLGEITGATVCFKPESLQRTGSFKIRGAFNKISSLSPEERARGVITYSSGNHGQGVACAAAMLNTRAVVVMPEDATGAKVSAAQGYGAEIHFAGLDSLQRQQRAFELHDQFGYTIVPPFDDPAIIAGQASVGLEILSELPDVNVVIVPLGGGGLLSGVALAVKMSQPQARVIGVEPAGGDDGYQSIRKGAIVTLDEVHTIADGLRTKRIGTLNFAVIQRYVDDIVTVTDGEIKHAMRWLVERAKLVVEPSGAVGIAAMLQGKIACDGKKVAVVLSGGNVDSTLLAEVLESRAN
jgi:threonine dehydratase